jgi:hypothetical protein
VTPTSRGTRGCAPTPTSTTLAATTTTTTWLKLGQSVQKLKICCFMSSSNLFKAKKKITVRLQNLQGVKQAIPRLINIDG